MPATAAQPTADTREQLLDAAEQLIIDHGFDGASARAIVRAAGQRNQSALQYHFGGREGLKQAILARRLAQVEARRAELLAAGMPADLRGVCALLVRGVADLAAVDRRFRAVFGAFGQQLLASDAPLLAQPDGAATEALRAHIRAALAELPVAVQRLRIEHANSLGLLAISRRARLGGSFAGAEADLFLNTLVDQVAAVLTAPVSAATRACIDQLPPGDPTT